MFSFSSASAAAGAVERVGQHVLQCSSASSDTVLPHVSALFDVVAPNAARSHEKIGIGGKQKKNQKTNGKGDWAQRERKSSQR